jgi:hypothetical protein
MDLEDVQGAAGRGSGAHLVVVANGRISGSQGYLQAQAQSGHRAGQGGIDQLVLQGLDAGGAGHVAHLGGQGQALADLGLGEAGLDHGCGQGGAAALPAQGRQGAGVHGLGGRRGGRRRRGRGRFPGNGQAAVEVRPGRIADPPHVVGGRLAQGLLHPVGQAPGHGLLGGDGGLALHHGHQLGAGELVAAATEVSVHQQVAGGVQVGSQIQHFGGGIAQLLRVLIPKRT